jgi:DNA processing protein
MLDMNSNKVIVNNLYNWTEDSDRDEELIYWVALNSIRNSIVLNMVNILLKYSKPVSALWSVDIDLLANAVPLERDDVKKLRVKFGKIHLRDMANDVEHMRNEGLRIIPLSHPRYPRRLVDRSIDSHPAPLVLLEKGEDINTMKSVAIVGTRNPSLKGRLSALEIADYFARKGYIIISGLARGIDEFAHVGALSHDGGNTIGVLPWLGTLYPPEHESLSEDIIKRGMIISDAYHRSLSFANKSRFIERNAIISGLSDFVIAIETDEEGGTIREAEIALKQGIQVYALHIVGNPRSERGYRKLTGMGAVGFENLAELEELLSKSKGAATPS